MNIKQIKAKVKKNFAQRAALVTAATIGVAVIVTLVKKNKMWSEDYMNVIVNYENLLGNYVTLTEGYLSLSERVLANLPEVPKEVLEQMDVG